MRVVLLACCLLLGCKPDEQNLGNTASALPDAGAAAAIGSARWAVAVGGGYDDKAVSTAIDSIGDVVAVGTQGGPKDSPWGSNPCSSFVTKRVASDGSERWTAQIVPDPPYSSFAYVTAVAIDAQDSIIVTGTFIGTVNFGGQTLSIAEPTPGSQSNMFLAKYTADGHLAWVRDLDALVAQGNAVAVDSAGRIFVAGGFTGPLMFGSDRYTGDDDGDGFLAAFDPSGKLVWGRSFQGPGELVANGVAVTASGDVIATGFFLGPSSFGGVTLDPGAYSRGFVTRYRNDGLFLWSRVVGVGAPGNSAANQVTVGLSGVVVQTTEHDDDTPWHPYAGLHRFDDAGQETWAARFRQDGNYSPQLRALAIGPTGSIMSSTWVDAPQDVEHPELVTGTMEVVSYDLTGLSGTTVIGRRLLAGFNQTFVHGSAATQTGAIAVAGEFAGQRLWQWAAEAAQRR